MLGHKLVTQIRPQFPKEDKESGIEGKCPCDAL